MQGRLKGAPSQNLVRQGTELDAGLEAQRVRQSTRIHSLISQLRRPIELQRPDHWRDRSRFQRDRVSFFYLPF